MYIDVYIFINDSVNRENTLYLWQMEMNCCYQMTMFNIGIHDKNLSGLKACPFCYSLVWSQLFCVERHYESEIKEETGCIEIVTYPFWYYLHFIPGTSLSFIFSTLYLQGKCALSKPPLHLHLCYICDFLSV